MFNNGITGYNLSDIAAATGDRNDDNFAEMALGGLSFYSYSHFADGAEMASDMVVIVQVL